jgi:TRAP-type uncharacterized transport system substrate-binding protein
MVQTCSALLVVGLILCVLSPSHVPAAEPYKIEISALWPASSMYVNAVYWSKMINEKHANIQAVAREGKGPNVDLKTLLSKPEKRPNLIFFGTEDDWWGAQQNFPGWDKFINQYDIAKIRHLCMIGFTTDVMLSVSPSIKTMYDMEGKTYVPATVDLNNAKALGMMEPFNLAGIKVKFEALGVGPMIESLRDGMIDVAHGGIALVGDKKFEPSAYLNELFAVKTVYPVTYDVKHLEAMKAKTGHTGVIVKFPPKSITPTQDYDVYGMGKSTGWMCDASMPDEIVTAILQVYYDNIEKFGEVSTGSKILNKNTMAALNVPESRYHPAALKFYKEKGVPIISIHDTGLLPK